MDDWLDSQLSEIGWRDARNRHITLHDAFRTYTKSDVTPKDLTLTSRGVDTGMDCESCGRSVDRLNGDEIFGQLLERYDAERARIGENVGSLDYWLERQVPWAIRRD